MAELTQAEQYLLAEIRRGSADGWSQLVERYEGRLRAFARSKLNDPGEADDLVQDTFVAFLKALPDYREEASLETYLFTILRRRVINAYRGRARHVCLLQDTATAQDGAPDDAIDRVASPDPTASWYARRDEDHRLQHEALYAALRDLIGRLKQSENLRDLQIIEMLFYCQLRNRDIAAIAGVSENHVALIKHRSLRQIQEHLARRPGASDAAALPSDTLLIRVWQDYRLSCLKRSTVGAWLLGTLEEPWRGYVAFHLDRLGCTFCRANLDDLREETAGPGTSTIRDRILESTVGFLRSSG